MPIQNFRLGPQLALILLVAIGLSGCQACYEGDTTLANYPEHTEGSEAARKTLLDLLGFWNPSKNTQHLSSTHLFEIAAFLITGKHTGWVHDVDTRSMNVRPTGPFVNNVAYNTHQRVRLYYSNGVVDWLVNGREGEIPDGEMIVKQMYPTDPADTSYGGDKVTGWAVMIRDKDASVDGWLWFLFFFPGTPSYGQPIMIGQYGMSFCISCHAGSDTDQNTYISINNINGEAPTDYKPEVPHVTQDPDSTRHLTTEAERSAMPPILVAGHGNQPTAMGFDVDGIDDLLAQVNAHRAKQTPELQARVEQHLGPHSPAVKDIVGDFIQKQASKPVSKPLEVANPAIENTFGRKPIDQKDVLGVPWNLAYDHTVPERTDPKNFVTSDNCRGCHDATQLLGGVTPAMMIYEYLDDDPEPDRKVNVSPFGEWGSSMMGLAGRDPIFLAQLESEKALRPELAEWTENLCLSCHQVAGQRQFHIDEAGEYYSSQHTYAIPDGKDQNADAIYGALGRDGVTCTVCHQITPEGLGDESTFTGRFNVNKEPGTMYGPFPDSEIKPHYMERGVGLKPRYGEQMKHAGLCGSCHTVQLPILAKGAETAPPQGSGRTSHEQTTYLEWMNSQYANDADKSCQGCHMPDKYDGGDPLTFRIANVEDGTFPYIDNRAEADLITPVAKEGYRRHTLVGLSVFANRMFQQFPILLGITTLDPGTPLTFGPTQHGAVHRLELTENEMLAIRAETAELKASLVDRNATNWRVRVQLENKAGHKFPSGVGFRRAFLQVVALDPDDKVLWASGRTNGAGVIVDAAGTPLESEFTTDWRKLQPNHTTIDQEDQVQIFETRTINLEGELTTSFLGLAEEKKDTRLLPLGWKNDGPYHEATRLRELGGGPLNPIRPGLRTTDYEIPVVAGEIDRVEVRLLYQSIPPYYLAERLRVEGPETERLFYLASYLNLEDTPAEDWSLEVVRTEVMGFDQR